MVGGRRGQWGEKEEPVMEKQGGEIVIDGEEGGEREKSKKRGRKVQ